MKMEASTYSDDDEIVPGTAPEALLSPSLLDSSIPASAVNNQHQQAHEPSQTEQEASPSGSYSNMSGSQRSPILLGPGSDKSATSAAVSNASNNSANAADDGPRPSASPPSSQPSSNAVPVTDYKKEKEDSSSAAEGGRDGKQQSEHEHEQGQAEAAKSETTMLSREEAIRSFNESWPAFEAATAPRESEGIYAYSHRVPPSIAKLLGPPIKELNFESERKQWEQYRQEAREREAAAKAAAAAGAPIPDPGMEWAMATLREDEKFRQDGIRMQERQERWDRGEYSDHDSDEDENSVSAKMRKRLRKPGAPTIAELAVIMGLRPDPSAAANDDGEDVQDVVSEKKQTLLAPLPDPTREWQKSRKGGKRRSSTDSGSGSDAHVEGNSATAATSIAAHSSTGKRSKSKESTSSRKKKKQKKSSGSGAGSSFLDKLRKAKKRPRDQLGDTQTDEEDDEAYPTKSTSSNLAGGRRIFDQTPRRKKENLSQTSIQEMFGKKK